MPWTKLDDGLYDHPKFLDLSLEAIGLWTLTLTWSTRQLTDGRLPRKAVDRLAAGNRRVAGIAAELTAAGLWDPEGDGWRIHDFHDYQPSSEQVGEERKKARERQQRHRTTKGQYGKSRRDKPVTTSEVTPGVTAETGVSHVHPDPTRPETPPAPSTDPPVTSDQMDAGGPAPGGGEGQNHTALADTAMHAAAAHELAQSTTPITNVAGWTKAKLAAYRPRRDRAIALAQQGATEAQLADWFATGTTPTISARGLEEIPERQPLTDEDHAARTTATTAARDVLRQRRHARRSGAPVPEDPSDLLDVSDPSEGAA